MRVHDEAMNTSSALIGTGKRNSVAAWTALAALAPMVWGTTYIVTTRFLPEGYPLFAALMRSLVPGIVALIIARQLPQGSWWWKSAILGALTMGIFFPLLFVSAQELPGGVAATVGAVQPLFIIVLAATVLHEKFSQWKASWAIVGVIAVGLVVLGPHARLSATGVIAALCAALSMAIGVVLTKKWGRPQGVSAIGYAGWQMTAAGLLLLVPTLIVGVPQEIDGRAWLGYAWLGGIGALFSYSIWFAAIRRLPVTSTGLLGLLSPLVATVIGVSFAGERFTAIQAIGFALAITALVAGQREGLRTRLKP